MDISKKATKIIIFAQKFLNSSQVAQITPIVTNSQSSNAIFFTQIELGGQ